MWLFLVFVAVPLVEIALFIQVGGLIGLWPTLAIVVLTALAGTYLMRFQGALAMGQIRDAFDKWHDPTEPLAHGAMILFAGALLLTPGFFTDTCGFLLLMPPVRVAAFRWLRKRVVVRHAGGRQPPPGGAPPNGPVHGARPDVIDGDYEDVTAGRPRGEGPRRGGSGWTRH